MQHGSQVFHRNQLLVVGPACYLLSWMLLELQQPVLASLANQQQQHRNPFAEQQSPPRAAYWLHSQHQTQPHQAHDHEANQQRALASLRELISAADRPSHLWNVDFPSGGSASAHMDNLAADQESHPGAILNGNINYALPAPQQHQQQHRQPPPATSMGSTAPSVNRQLMAPPSFYELALAPTSSFRFDAPNSNVNTNTNTEDSSSGPMNAHLAAALTHHFRSADAQRDSSAASNSFSRPSLMARSLGGQSSGGAEEAPAADEQSMDSSKSQASADGTEPKNSSDEPASGNPDDKVIEPRQRRRIFNRILKKAEWNHLFVELSKVFLKYFLDLALKDIIGKQSGSETTTSRKKLDAQSELTDLLKDFFKTAISNI